jgi:hypothetical protein
MKCIVCHFHNVRIVLIIWCEVSTQHLARILPCVSSFSLCLCKISQSFSYHTAKKTPCRINMKCLCCHTKVSEKSDRWYTCQPFSFEPSLSKEDSMLNQHRMSLLSAKSQFKIRTCVYLPLPIFILLEILFLNVEPDFPHKENRMPPWNNTAVTRLKISQR